MRLPRESGRGAGDRRGVWLWVLSLFLIGLGARLWLIARFGTPLPFWDQWEEARVVYIPFFEGKLSLADLFSAHNEHRIFFTRIYGLGLLLLNGQWDNQLQTVANAILHCGTMTGLGWLMCRWLEKRSWILLWLPLVLVLALPFGWENSLAGFQSQFYFLVLFSLLTLWLLGLQPSGSRLWWCGVAAAMMALFTVGSGFLAAVTVFALVVFRICRQPEGWKRQTLTLAVCAAVAAAGLLLKTDVLHHHLLQAHSAGEFLAALGANLAWPWIVVPSFAFLNLLPLALLAWRYFKKRDESSPAAEMTLAIGMWAVLQAAATAYARGADGRPPGWRYMDSTSFILVANCFSIAVLLSSYRFSRRSLRDDPFGNLLSAISPSGSRLIRSARLFLLTVLSLWAVACIAGLALLSLRAWQIDIPERQLCFRAQLQLARAFMATDDPRVFDHEPRSYLLAYQGDPLAPPLRYEAEWTVEYLRNPTVRNLLPACVRLPLAVQADPAATHGFVTNAYRLAKRGPPTEAYWGSYTEDGVAAKSRFQSMSVTRSKLRFLEFRVAGDLGKPGLSLDLLDLTSGKTTSVKPPQAPGDHWQTYQVRAPHGDFKIIASDESDSGWFAFQAPREAGRLSWLAARLVSFGGSLFIAGVGNSLICLAIALRRRPKGPTLRQTANPERPFTFAS